MRRVIREFGLGPGCAFWLMRGPVGGGESPLPSDRLHSEHDQGRGAGLGSMPYVK